MTLPLLIPLISTIAQHAIDSIQASQHVHYAILPLLLMGAGTLASTLLSAKANQDRQDALNNRQRNLDAWYNDNYNKDNLDNIDAKAGMRTVLNNINRQDKAANNTAAMMGSSDESQVANKEQQNRTYADFVNQLAAKGQNRRDNIQNSYMIQKNALDNQQDNLTAGKQQSYANMASNAGNILSAASSANSIGAFDPSTTVNPTSSVVSANSPLKPLRSFDLWNQVRTNDNPNTIKNNGLGIPLLNQ